MVRLVVGEGRTLVPDLAERLPGRGIWLSAEGDVIETARASSRLARAVARAAGGAVVVPVDLLGRLEAGLTERIAALLGVARRAGQAVAGRAEVSAWRAEGCVGLCLQAKDAALPWDDEPPFVRVPAAVFGAAFGPDAVGPVAIRRGRLAEAVRCEVGRLEVLGFGCSKVGRGERVHDGRQ